MPTEPVKKQEQLESENAEPVAPETGEAVAEIIEPQEENPVEVEDQIEQLKKDLEKPSEVPETPQVISPEERQKKIQEYRDKYLPDYLKKKQGMLFRAISAILPRILGIKTEGKEKTPPKGPCLVVCNHFGGGDVEAIMQNFRDKDVHFALAKGIWWDRNPILRWGFKKMGMIPVNESLAHLSPEEKKAARDRQVEQQAKDVFTKIIEREERGELLVDKDFIRQSVAVLLKGDAVAVFPEGAWLNPQGFGTNAREEAKMKQGYEGIELITREYKRVTGEELPIIPTALDENMKTGEKKFTIGDAVFADKNDEVSLTQRAMVQVARMLPEEKRGYYKDKV